MTHISQRTILCCPHLSLALSNPYQRREEGATSISSLKTNLHLLRYLWLWRRRRRKGGVKDSCLQYQWGWSCWATTTIHHHTSSSRNHCWSPRSAWMRQISINISSTPAVQPVYFHCKGHLWHLCWCSCRCCGYNVVAFTHVPSALVLWNAS